ncbi:MAG: class I SAM-dependent methyltransferase [Ilumatobacteraceae bacterium]
MPVATTTCRVCGNSELVPVLNLGEQYLTGTFPRTTDGKNLTKGPLQLVKCHGAESTCGLLQLEHSYDPSEMYGANYGYRSGLNSRMVQHLKRKVARILDSIDLQPGDLVVDIGSNDGTTLGFFPESLTLVGVDPTAGKFADFYGKHVHVIPDFFSGKTINDAFPGKKAKVISSFAMFYDLERPVNFASEIQQVLHAEGIWVFEQSYLPSMLQTTAYDTVCHEHVEYYGLAQIEWILAKVGMQVIDVELNDTNGGSFSVVVAQKNSLHKVNEENVAAVRKFESNAKLESLDTYSDFATRVGRNKDELSTLINGYNGEGKRVCGIGASTKGNVILQYCGFGLADIEMIGDINSDKFGAFTPGSWIPIRSETDVLDSRPDVMLVLPWHFREFFLSNTSFAGRNLLFPLPQPELVTP